MVAENLTNIDLYRNANGKFVARDPDTGETYPVPFESVDVERLEIVDNTAFWDGSGDPQNALDDANNVGIKRVIFPSGDFTAYNIRPNAGQTVIGAGKFETMVRSTTGSGITNPNVTIRDMGFASIESNVDALRASADNISFESCYVQEADRRGIVVNGTVQFGIVKGCVVDAVGSDEIRVFGDNSSVESCVVNGVITDSGTNNSIGDGNVIY